MILYEFEGKKLLSEAGIKVPKSQLVTSLNEPINLSFPVVLKAQVLSGKRKDVGGIVIVDSDKSLESRVKEMFGKIINKEVVEKILAEEKVEFDKEYYISLSYDTDTRGPLLTISEEGGTGVEGRRVQTFPIDPLNPINNLPNLIERDLLESIIKLFFDQDCLLLEINPLVKIKGNPSTSLRSSTLRDEPSGSDSNETSSSEGTWVALDAKIKLDDDAKARHEEWAFPPRGVPGYTPTTHEIEAKKIDQGDYRGVAGSTYFDLDGDIAVLSSGGGVSLTALDSLLSFGGKPANYTEYSGNPPKEKVTKLTKVVLSKPDIHGLWIIGTVAANFTDIYETLSGIIEGLQQVSLDFARDKQDRKLDFPIVVRRGGPRDKEAYQMLKQITDFDLILQGEEVSISQSAQIMAELTKKYATST